MDSCKPLKKTVSQIACLLRRMENLIMLGHAIKISTVNILMASKSMFIRKGSFTGPSLCFINPLVQSPSH